MDFEWDEAKRQQGRVQSGHSGRIAPASAVPETKKPGALVKRPDQVMQLHLSEPARGLGAPRWKFIGSRLHC